MYDAKGPISVLPQDYVPATRVMTWVFFLMSLIPYGVYLNASAGAAVWINAHRVGALLVGSGCGAVWLWCIIRGRVPRWMISASMVIATFGLVSVDWASASTPGGARQYHITILLIDVLLFYRSRDTWVYVVLAIMTVWLLVDRSERAYRWGLYRIDGWSTPSDDVYDTFANCDDQPCAQGMSHVAQAIIVDLLILYASAIFAFIFVRAERKAQGQLVSALELSKAVAMLLSRLELSAANELLDSEVNKVGSIASEPISEMAGAFRMISDHLAGIAVFLPEGIAPRPAPPRDDDCFSDISEDLLTPPSESRRDRPKKIKKVRPTSADKQVKMLREQQQAAQIFPAPTNNSPISPVPANSSATSHVPANNGPTPPAPAQNGAISPAEELTTDTGASRDPRISPQQEAVISADEISDSVPPAAAGSPPEATPAAATQFKVWKLDGGVADNRVGESTSGSEDDGSQVGLVSGRRWRMKKLAVQVRVRAVVQFRVHDLLRHTDMMSQKEACKRVTLTISSILECVFHNISRASGQVIAFNATTCIAVHPRRGADLAIRSALQVSGKFNARKGAEWVAASIAIGGVLMGVAGTPSRRTPIVHGDAVQMVEASTTGADPQYPVRASMTAMQECVVRDGEDDGLLRMIPQLRWITCSNGIEVRKRVIPSDQLDGDARMGSSSTEDSARKSSLHIWPSSEEEAAERGSNPLDPPRRQSLPAEGPASDWREPGWWPDEDGDKGNTGDAMPGSIGDHIAG
eukprot:TRINITY_DN69988_c0_g1_i1.p1 TRINITY_DN69988_c0_g1~~TRINITY_DN69988_c0_g1_i1.p1  ORF type:complete len:750 (+),score=138.39 TRINITY_DN69988_c0_g1_i1:118-2367(+)